MVSLGAHYARTSRDFRSLAAAGGDAPAASEQALELTAADQVLPFLTLQPDVQLVLHPGGLKTAHPVVVTALRLTFPLPGT
jgi:porin